MTQKELIEMIQQHHPDAGETMIRKTLNRAQNDFSAKTGMVHGIADDVLVGDKRFYDLDPGMLEIKKVEIDNIAIKRLVVPPVEGDIS